MKKRVWALYRVSTERQTDSDDEIPMQKNAVHNFIEKQNDWILDREFVEIDVSGYKLKSSERGELVKIMDGAKAKQFEVFLVFMFDRIGRRWDDSPQVVEGIVNSGVEVWSTKEGQQKFDTHVDRLMNYITYWQAGGESLKTSIRVKEQMGQLNEEGRYMGGVPPFGYKLYDSGEFKKDKKGKKLKELKAIQINEEEAIIVKLIYNLTLDKGYGATRICRYLNENNYRSRNNGRWRTNYVSRILRNSIYMGHKRYGVVMNGYDKRFDIENMKLQPFNENYVIIPKDIWLKVQKATDQRKNVVSEKENYPIKSALLLTGLVRCGYCQRKLTTDYSVKYYSKKDNTLSKYKVLRYVCDHRKSYNTGFEHETMQFGAKKYEFEVIEMIKDTISQINLDSFEQKFQISKLENIKNQKKELEKRYREIKEKENENIALQSLRIKVELGQSKLSSETIEEMMIKCQNDILDMKNSIKKFEEEIIIEQQELSNMQDIKEDLMNWEDTFNKTDIDGKKMMITKIISNIFFKKNEITIDTISPIRESMKRKFII